MVEELYGIRETPLAVSRIPCCSNYTKIRKNNQLMVGMNILNNLFHELNNVIPLDW
jgi:hypothetical protein